ncbi:MAG: membrane protein insertion efficiency factor YidD [Gammaproteobacteria bacterium]|nr:membrane protein insertion efficiency factor YidD [Gammaproteobacteria bacterium]
MAVCKKSMQTLLIRILKLYRLALSPYLGQHCRFAPTCSCYTIEAIETYGTLRGGYLALRRLLRCHPWCAGGFDPLPRATNSYPCLIEHARKHD